MSYAALPSSEQEQEEWPRVQRRRTSDVIRLAVAAFLVASALASGFLAGSSLPRQADSTSKPSWETLCSPIAFDTGHWRERIPRPRLQTFDDVLAAGGYRKCAAEFQPTWNMGVRGKTGPYPEHEDKVAYEWVPHPTCAIGQTSARAKLQALIDSPLFIVGDSKARQHFFALSCDLGEHVIWKGGFTANDDNGPPYEWRLEDQNLYLDPQSPVFAELHFPPGFDISKSIVTERMAYVPQSREEMRQLVGLGVNVDFLPAVNMLPGNPVNLNEFSQNRTIEPFTNPDSHFKTMLLSTGAHFGIGHLIGDYKQEDDLAIVRASMKAYYTALLSRMRSDQQVLVRAALAAHSNCDDDHSVLSEVRYQEPWGNVGFMEEINAVIESETRLTGDARMHWLGLSRFSRLKPNGHLPNDCMHWSVGTGTYESINRYLFHVLANP